MCNFIAYFFGKKSSCQNQRTETSDMTSIGKNNYSGDIYIVL